MRGHRWIQRAHHDGNDDSEGSANAQMQVGIVWTKEDRNKESDIAARQRPETLGRPAQHLTFPPLLTQTSPAAQISPIAQPESAHGCPLTGLGRW